MIGVCRGPAHVLPASSPSLFPAFFRFSTGKCRHLVSWKQLVIKRKQLQRQREMICLFERPSLLLRTSLASSSLCCCTLWRVCTLLSDGRRPPPCWHSHFKCFQTSPHFGKYGWKTINIVQCHNWFILHSGEQRCQNSSMAVSVRLWTDPARNGFHLRAARCFCGLLSLPAPAFLFSF